MKLLYTLLLLIATFSSHAQLQPTIISLTGIGGDGADAIMSSVGKTADGGFIIYLSSTSNLGTGNIDTFCNLSGNKSIFIKYGAYGENIEWNKCYSYALGDTMFSNIFPVEGGSNVLGGQFLSDYGWGFYITKHDATDNILWSRSYSVGNSPLLHDMIATADGGYIMAGNVYYTDSNFTVHNSGSFYSDIGILKLDSLGNKIWSKAIGGTSDESPKRVIETPEGYYVIGYTTSNDFDCIGNHGGNDLYVVRLDVNGNIVWHRDYGGSEDEGGQPVWKDGHGGLIIAGLCTSSDGDVTHHNSLSHENFWIIDIDSTGNIKWDNCYSGGRGDCSASSMCKATDGSIWLAGISQRVGAEVTASYGRDDAWFVHADSAGNFLSAKVLGSAQDDAGTLVYPLSNGSVLGGGAYSANGGTFGIPFYGSSDAFLVKFAPWTAGTNKLIPVNFTVTMYPNPVSKEINIKTSTAGNYKIKITDVVNHLVYDASIFHGDVLSIPVNLWKRSSYLVQVINEAGSINIEHIIIK